MNLRTARFIRGITQIELQARSGVFQSRLSLFERGYAYPTGVEKQRIEAVLGPIDWTTPPKMPCLQKVERRF